MSSLSEIVTNNAGMIAAIAAGSLLALAFWSYYNRLSALDERCETALADVDALLKHRHDLIPGLIESVRGFAGHESTVLTAVTEARAKALQAARPEMKLDAETQLGQSINSLFSLVENYPNLQAGSHFKELRVELEGAHSRITAARRFYNLATNEFNSTLRQFPANLVGAVLRFGRRKALDVNVSRETLEAPIPLKF